MARVFVTRQVPGPALDRLRAAHDVDVWAERLPPSREQLLRRAGRVEGLLAMLSDRIDAELIAACPELRAIANYAVGYDNVDLVAAAARGIVVGNTPDVLTDATADLAFALLMAAARRLPAALENARSDWTGWEPGGFLGASVQGTTLAVIGGGRIGQAMARRAAGFNMTVLIVGRDDDPGPALQQADFVSLHVPLTAQTRHLIDAAALARMKPTAILVNTARGEVVDQAALGRALQEGEIAGAALDVTSPEPLPPDDPLWSAPNLLITPHIGSATRPARERMTEIAVENLLSALAGRPMPHQVTA